MEIAGKPKKFPANMYRIILAANTTQFSTNLMKWRKKHLEYSLYYFALNPLTESYLQITYTHGRKEANLQME